MHSIEQETELSSEKEFVKKAEKLLIRIVSSNRWSGIIDTE